MKEPTKEIKLLAAKWMDGTITPEEKLRFDEWYNSLDFSELELLNHWASGREELEAHLLQKLQTSLTRSLITRWPGTRSPATRWLAAASVLLLIGAGTYFFHFRKKTGPEIAAKQIRPANVAPGRNGAVLTLADGSQMILDSTANQQIPTQGGSQVHLQNGAVVYENEKPAESAKPNPSVLYNTLTTPRGRQFRLVLPDGSAVWLNAASTLRYPTAFTGGQRTVELTGEAYFEIAKDPKKPFVVSTRGMSVQVLGTAFDLMAYPDEKAVNTTLITGAIKVVAAKNSLLLNPDQQASLADSAGRFTVSKPNLKEVLAWKEGRFRFDGAKITGIMRQIARWYDVDIEYRGEIPSNEFNGSISRAEYAEKILNALERTGNVHFLLEGRKIIVMAGATGTK